MSHSEILNLVLAALLLVVLTVDRRVIKSSTDGWNRCLDLVQKLADRFDALENPEPVCEHKWAEVERVAIWDDPPKENPTGMTAVLRCEKCGNMKNHHFF